MNYLDLTIEDIHKALKANQITPYSLVMESLKRAEAFQPTYNSFVTILNEALEVSSLLKAGDKVTNPLYGIPYALKDNISTKGILTTASSNILKDYLPFFDATVVEKLKDKHAILIGKTVLDELAIAGNGTTGHTGIVRNPWDKKRLIGGSSAGSASAVALGIVPFALGSDTGDSVRKPAAFGGVVGFKPTYGRVSRYGLFPFACSLDHIGSFTRSVKDAAYVIDAIKGKDDRDMTSFDNDNTFYKDMLDGKVVNKKLCYIKEIVDPNNYKAELSDELAAVLNNFKEVILKCEELGIIVEAVSINQILLEALFPTYIAISSAEATSNNANLTGLIFGPRGKGETIKDIIFDARTKGFSELLKKRFILGNFVLQKENQDSLFLNAKRIRRMIVDQINNLFTKYDGLILPSSGGAAPKLGDNVDKSSKRYLLLENHLVIANFGGFPSISIPSGFFNKLPLSINLTGPAFKDGEVLNIAYALESKLGYKGLIAKEVKDV